MHKISDKFEFLPDRTSDYGVIRPWAFPLTLNGQNGVSIFSQLLWIQTSSNLQEMRRGIKSRTGSKFGRIWPVILELPALQQWKKNDVSSFSQSPFIGSLSNLQVMRTGIKARTSSNLGQIGFHFGVICPWAPIFNPRGYIHVLNHEQNCIKSDFKEMSLKLATNGKRDKAFLLTPKFSRLGSLCPCAGAICIKSWKKIV